MDSSIDRGSRQSVLSYNQIIIFSDSNVIPDKSARVRYPQTNIARKSHYRMLQEVP